MAVLAVLWQPHLMSSAVLLYSHQLWRVTASIVSCRLEEIDEFFARNNEEYLALIFEKEGSYVGREVSCPQGAPQLLGSLWEREPREFESQPSPANSQVSALCTS